MRFVIRAALPLLISAAAEAQSPVLLDQLFQDHAVLQRDKPIIVWGRAPADDVVTVSLAAATVEARADFAGHWVASIPPQAAGGPFVLSARTRSGATQSATDVLIGDVFLCSGQSNMEFQVEHARDSRREISASANNTIRMLTVERRESPVPLADFKTPVTWQVAGPDTVANWSAACFFFARELQPSIHVPIGLINSSWGGTNIRPWISSTALRRIAGYEAGVELLAEYAKEPAVAQQHFATLWEEWWRARSGDAPGTEPWRAAPSPAPGADGWREAPAVLRDWHEWNVAELTDFTGLLWYRTSISLTAAEAASAVALSLGPISQIDESWVNGNAIANTFGFGTERRYPLAPGTLHAGSNLLVVGVFTAWGSGGLLEGGAKRAVHLANGASVPLEGMWQYRTVPVAIGSPPRSPWEPIAGLSTIYNSMIAPLGSYGLRGVLWYQGESNTVEASSYQPLLTGLFAGWRSQFGADLPFLVVQLPNFGPLTSAPGESGWADIREAQRRAVAADAHAGLAVTIDIGDPRDLHPANKQDVGKRLARTARHVIYGEAISASGPVALAAARVAGSIAVTFGDMDGRLTASGHDGPRGFELCGDTSGSCHYVDARIDGSRVLLSEPKGPPASRIRYCWADSPTCTLVDESALPAGPFEMRIPR
jgi:sialate O-acetylesterase